MVSVDNIILKNTPCIQLTAGRYFAVVCPELGASVLRMRDNERGMEIFRYVPKASMKAMKASPEVWGLPTLYLPNRFDNGLIKTSDGEYHFPLNDKLGNFLHGWVHKRVHTVGASGVKGGKAFVRTSYTFGKGDEMYDRFPIDFRIEYTFTLSEEEGLREDIKLTNLSKDRMLPVSLCTHTCLKAPMTDGKSADGMRLLVPVEERCELTKRALPTEKLLPLSAWDKEYRKGTKRPVGQIINNDMYTASAAQWKGEEFYGTIVTDKKSGNVLLNEVSKEFKFWNMWNCWGKRGYFCPEPMTAMINSPNLSLPRKVSGYTELKPGKSYKCWQSFRTDSLK